MNYKGLKEFRKSLELINKIRKERGIAYGNGWRKAPLLYNIYQLYGKVLRMLWIIVEGKSIGNNYEKLIDTAADAIIYSFFILETIIDINSELERSNLNKKELEIYIKRRFYDIIK